MNKKQYFIAGTDTGVGKTLVTASLLKLAGDRGLRSMGLKPVAAGCEMTEGGLRNEDALTLARYASIKLSYDEINPVALASAIAPHIAADQVGKKLSAQRIVGYCRGSMMQPHDVCLVEGAGGWRVPLGRGEYMSTIAQQLSLPVILVVGMRLGCLNHALLSAEAVLRDGLNIAAWVANVVDGDMSVCQENILTLRECFSFPLLGTVPYQEGMSPETASEHLDINKIL